MHTLFDRSLYQCSLVLFSLVVLTSCQSAGANKEISGPSQTINLPEPDKSFIPHVNIARTIAWPDGLSPIAKNGFKVNLYVKELEHPRWLYKLPNGDILVAQSNKPSKNSTSSLKEIVAKYVMKIAGAGVDSPDKITLLRGSHHNDEAEIRSDFLTNLHSPFGMALIGHDLYIANTDAIVLYHYEDGQLMIDTKKYPPEKIIDLPAGDINHHWTKNILPSQDQTKLLITVGSNSNVGENGLDNEKNRAAILELDLKTKKISLYASGLRNPNGLAFDENGHLWTVVNERDELGDNLVPDYLTEVSQGDFFGWPYSYYGHHADSRITNNKLNLNPRIPDYALGAHVAALGLTFAKNTNFNEFYQNGVFISEHGSWNRTPKSGYKVVFVPFKNGSPFGKPIDIVTGFLNKDEQAYGRPVGLVVNAQGNLLVADDVGNRIWQISRE